MPEWMNVVLKSLFVLAYLFVLAKLIGKRQLRQLTYLEYIVGITVGSIAAEVATNLERSLVHGALIMSILGGFVILADWLALKNKSLRDFFEGKSTVLIKDGKILEDNLKKERLTVEDLMEQLRVKKVFKVADVEFATIETSGEVSILLKSENQPITPKLLGLTVSPADEPQAVILDGEIMDEPLSTIGLNREWLHTELAKAGVPLENVFLAQVDKYGQLYLDLFDDKLMVPEPQTTKLTYATLKKCQADLELYALATKNQEMKKSYAREAKRLQHVLDSVEPLLMR